MTVEALIAVVAFVAVLVFGFFLGWLTWRMNKSG